MLVEKHQIQGVRTPYLWTASQSFSHLNRIAALLQSGLKAGGQLSNSLKSKFDVLKGIKISRA
jgi:hypothetical protein